MHDQLTQEEELALCSAQQFGDGVAIATACLERLAARSADITILCGPMTSGGSGNFAQNMARFNLAMAIAHDHDHVVFNQVAFQDMMARLTGHTPDYRPPGSNTLILEGFYRPIFELGIIQTSVFLPQWETSEGATWERKVLGELGVRIVDFPPQWRRELARREALPQAQTAA